MHICIHNYFIIQVTLNGKRVLHASFNLLNDWIQVEPGVLPIILMCPHGGKILPANCCKRSSDQVRFCFIHTIYIYICIGMFEFYIYTYVYFTYICMYMCSIHMYICTYVFKYIHIYIYKYKYICIYV